jgi:hypothetical protein
MRSRSSPGSIPLSRRFLAVVPLAVATLGGCAVSIDEDLWKHAKDGPSSVEGPAGGDPSSAREGSRDLSRELALDAPRPGERPGETAPHDLGPCTTGAFQCVSGGAIACSGGGWVSLGSCPLGCVAASKACYVPSNVSADLVSKGTGAFDLTGLGTAVAVDSDTGAIAGLRSAGAGLDTKSGIYFAQASQGSGKQGLGVFSATTLVLPKGTGIAVSGSRALVILVAKTAAIDGTIDVSASHDTAGPGGYDGGSAGATGSGACPGKAGKGYDTASLCSSGGGGAGFGGAVDERAGGGGRRRGRGPDLGRHVDQPWSDRDHRGGGRRRRRDRERRGRGRRRGGRDPPRGADGRARLGRDPGRQRRRWGRRGLHLNEHRRWPVRPGRSGEREAGLGGRRRGVLGDGRREGRRGVGARGRDAGAGLRGHRQQQRRRGRRGRGTDPDQRRRLALAPRHGQPRDLHLGRHEGLARRGCTPGGRLTGLVRCRPGASTRSPSKGGPRAPCGGRSGPRG